MVTGLALRTLVLDDAVVVAAAREVVIASAPQLAEMVAAVIRAPAGTGCILCDLAQVTFLDCAGISSLLAGRNLATANGMEFCLFGATGQVRKMLRLTAMDRPFRCHDSLCAALRAAAHDPDPLTAR